MAKRQSRNAMNPLPSLLKASAFDAANMRMMKDGRKQWNEDDWNAMCETQERLITSCYGKKDDADEHLKYIRFQIAGQLEQAGIFGLETDYPALFTAIDEHIAQGGMSAFVQEASRAAA